MPICCLQFVTSPFAIAERDAFFDCIKRQNRSMASGVADKATGHNVRDAARCASLTGPGWQAWREDWPKQPWLAGGRFACNGTGCGPSAKRASSRHWLAPGCAPTRCCQFSKGAPACRAALHGHRVLVAAGFGRLRQRDRRGNRSLGIRRACALLRGRRMPAARFLGARACGLP